MSNTPVPTSTSSLSYIQVELGKILRQHDPNAVRLYDFLQHVRVFQYNTNEYQWKKDPQIEGNLFVYEKQQMMNNQRSTIFALAVINREDHFIEEIPGNITVKTDKQRLFYEITKNNKPEVYALHFLNEHECQRIYTFINRVIEHEQSPPVNNIPRQQTPVHVSDFHHQNNPVEISQVRNIPTPTHSINNVNSNPEDPSSSLKRLLNIPKGNPLVAAEEQQQSIALLPPSAFQSLSISSDTQLHREHIRRTFLHLIQHNDQVMQIIQHACSTHQSP